MVYVKWLAFAITEKFMDLVNLFTAPIVVLFASEDGWLPSIFYWWQTPDNSLDGDEGWQTKRPFTKNTGIYRYVNRVFWLYRNSMYGYANSVVGIYKSNMYALYTSFTSELGYKPSDYDVVGGKPLVWKLICTETSKMMAFQFYWVHLWGSGRYKLRVNLGWKLWDWYNPLWSACNCVLSINPWKRNF